MNVYYGENFWGCGAAMDSESENTGRVPGRKVPLKLGFCYAGEQFWIPALYCFPEGITVDVVVLPDEQKVRERIRVYEEEYSSMSEEEQAVFEAQAEENLRLPVRAVKVNGIEGKFCGSCFGYWFPWQPDSSLDPIREEYADFIPQGRLFGCMRFHADIHFMEDEVESLSLYMAGTDKLLPVQLRFETGIGDEPGKKLASFRHPRTGEVYELYLCGVEPVDLENIDFRPMGIPEKYALQVEFETVPPLDKGERLYLKDLHYYKQRKSNQCCSVIVSSQQDEGTEAGGTGTEERVEEGEAKEAENTDTVAKSDEIGKEADGSGEQVIEIIGGADGSTSIFLCGRSGKGNRKGPHGGEYGSFITDLTIQEQRFARLAVIGIYTEDEPEQEVAANGQGIL